ncbi:hypothetical protein AGMMS49960_05170 [Betaproteobacteria bacterium]|nr:hypothetical protein AGMMS49543_05270 [Betaproteobacteria bacterium]GHT99567.1 hypothetical protein AGMMS49960_05170 [Betaproteobacteria bacterium]GHU06531.1 hypothetical protein AGMMS50225_01720 [Betaproteobacteria bacterium]GHU20988.1 hypothetical protein AGMMS50243_17560 [Betaproteobacteria bacterium]
MSTTVTYYQLAVTGNLRVLDNLAHLLDKATAHATANKIEERALLDARLFPDMFPLVRQIRMVCDMSRNHAAWLTGKEAPQFGDTETSFADFKTRIANSIAYLQTFQDSDFAASAEREVRLPWSPDKAYRGEVFLLQHSIPNLYFHLTTAYNILRHNGVPVGKADFLGAIG